MKAMYLQAFVAGFMVLGGSVPASSESGSFYSGKRLNFLINFAPGGATDIEGRFIARHLQRHIEGTPGITIRNMDGAGGQVGTNYLGEVASPDGLTVGYLSGAAWKSASDPRPARVPLESYDFVAYQSGAIFYYVRRDVPPGIKASADFLNAKGVVAGGLAVDSAKDLTIRLTLDMLGIPFKYVTGYKGNQGARLALQQGEINFYSESLPAYHTVLEPSFVATGEVLPLYYDPRYDGTKISPSKDAEALGLESFPDFYRRTKGKDPDGELWEAYKSIISLATTLQRLILLPPGSPPEATNALRAAFGKMVVDPDYRKEAMKIFGIVPDVTFDDDVQETIQNALKVSPEMKKWVADYVANPPR